MLAAVNAEILTIGDEICRGEIINTNASWLATKLWEMDITTTWMSSCRDEPEDMAQAFTSAVKRAELVICTGGLGPTLDDRTCDVLAGLCNKEILIHEPSLAQMKEKYESRGRKLLPKSKRQVRTIESASTYLNPTGAAPGFSIGLNNAKVICLPGPPSELKAIFNTYLLDEIRELKRSKGCLLYTSPSPRDATLSRMPSSA